MPPESWGLVPEDGPTLGGRKEGITRPRPLPCRPILAFCTASGAWVDRPLPVLALRLVYPPFVADAADRLLGPATPPAGMPAPTADCGCGRPWRDWTGTNRCRRSLPRNQPVPGHSTLAPVSTDCSLLNGISKTQKKIKKQKTKNTKHTILRSQRHKNSTKKHDNSVASCS